MRATFGRRDVSERPDVEGLGRVLDGLEEPVFSEPESPGRPTWRNLGQILSVLVARMRLRRG